MYRLTIFVLVSCVASQRLVGAARRGGSLSNKRNLYFDSYNHPALEGIDESEEDLREAVLMHPEEVLDIPPVSAELDYDTTDLDTDDSVEDYPYESLRDSKLTRNFIKDLIQKIKEAFAKWRPGSQAQPPAVPDEYYYHFDSSLVESQQTYVKVLLATLEEKTCYTVVEREESPDILFMGAPGCSVEAVENKLIIGYDCFEPTMVLKVMFRLFKMCPEVIPLPEPGSGRHQNSFRNKFQRAPEEESDCSDKFPLCYYLANGNSSLPCSSSSHAHRSMCSHTCRVCGDTCVDHDPDCNTHDTLKDCLLDWNRKRFGCAKTCGACKNRKDDDFCIDYFGCCRYYAKKGYCPRYPKLMKEYCPLSCGYCKPNKCADERNDCPELERMGGCKKMAALMGKSCRRTCKLCGNGMENRDSDDKKPPENCEQDVEFIVKYCSWNPFILV